MGIQDDVAKVLKSCRLLGVQSQLRAKERVPLLDALRHVRFQACARIFQHLGDLWTLIASVDEFLSRRGQTAQQTAKLLRFDCHCRREGP
jgi:hypothetical protein